MEQTITISMPVKEKERLARLALSYGFSLPEFSRHVLESLSLGMLEESFDDYENPEQVRASFNRSLHDYKTGNVADQL